MYRDRSDDQDLCALLLPHGQKTKHARVAHCEGANGPAFPPLGTGLCAYVRAQCPVTLSRSNMTARHCSRAGSRQKGQPSVQERRGRRRWPQLGAARCPPSPTAGPDGAPRPGTRSAHVDMAKRWDPFRPVRGGELAPQARTGSRIVACAEGSPHGTGNVRHAFSANGSGPLHHAA